MPPSSVSYSPPPSLRVVPRKGLDFRLGDLAVQLAAAYGLAADEWQADPVRCIYCRRRDGRWAAATTKISVPRQNGKNGIIEIVELFGMVALGLKFLHTAHEVKTARKAFRRLLSFFENEKDYPELAAMVSEIRKTNGQECIVLTNGGSVEFIARSSGSGRGFTVDVLVCDEDQDLTDDELAALLPTISAAPSGNPMVILTGTPPDPDKAHLHKGEVARRVRQDAVKRTDPNLCCFDWGVPDGPLPDIDNQDLWHSTNPALGIRLNIAEVRRERKMMAPETFARERLGWWGDPDASGTHDFPVDAWLGCTDGNPKSAPPKMGAFAIEVDLDRAWASIGTAGVRKDGRIHVELIDRRRGTSWIVDRCVELNTKHGPAKFVIDGAGAAQSLEHDLRNAGFDVLMAGTGDVASACASFVDATTDIRIAHGPDGDLDAAASGCKRRAFRDGGFSFSRRRSDVDVTPLIAVILAFWAVTTLDRAPQVWSLAEMAQQILIERAAESDASSPETSEHSPGVTFHRF